MEANRDEAERCYKLALDALDALDYTKAERMAKKSCYLHPTQKAKALFEKIQLITKGKSKSNTSSSPSSSPPHSFTFSSSSSSSKKSSTTTSNSLPPHTPEQLQLVKTINAHPLHAYYPILDLPQTASESDIKKAYRKLALLLHPDKNSAPGADDAFKKVSKAFSVLSDPQKRATYDRLGTDPDLRGGGSSGTSRSSSSSSFYFSHDDPDDLHMELDPEELFRAFFGPGFSSSFHTARGPHSIRRDRDRGGGGGGGGRFGRGHGHGTHPGTPRNALSWHFLPIVLVMVLSFFHQWNQPPAYPEYTFQPHFQLRYPIITPTYHVKAYVHEPTWMDFQHHYPHEKRTYLKSIEHAFLHQLHSQCKSEKKKKSDDLSRYKGWFWSSSPSDPQRYQEVLSRPLAACEKLKGLGIPPDAPLYFADR